MLTKKQVMFTDYLFHLSGLYSLIFFFIPIENSWKLMAFYKIGKTLIMLKTYSTLWEMVSSSFEYIICGNCF